MGYEEKIERIFGSTLEYNGDHAKAIEDVKIWLCGEWQCGMIEDSSEYLRLCDKADEIADRIIKNL